jgi:hypothetical protein
MALWERMYIDKQLRNKHDWELVTGIGECKGGLERFLPSRPLTSRHYLLFPPSNAIRDALGRFHVRIGVTAAVPFAFPGAHTPHERLFLPLRLAVYEVQGEQSVVETSLKWIEYVDGYLPEQTERCWRFWGAKWEGTGGCEDIASEKAGRGEGGDKGEVEEVEDWEAAADACAVDDNQDGGNLSPEVLAA